MRHLERPTPSKGPHLRSQSGQAVTEYLLVMVVVVGIALGVLYQLNTAFKKYVQSYFGDYIACLLETGEMPSLGGGDGANAGTCSAAFEPFSMKNGRPLASGGDSGSDGGSNSRKFSRSSNSSGRSPRVNRRNSAMNAERNNNGGIVAGSTSSTGSKKSVRGGGNINSGNFRFRTARMRGDEQIRLDSRFVFSKDKDGSKDSSIIKEIDAKGNNSSRATRKLAVNMDLFKPKEAPPEVNLDLSAGDYLRYILIFAILIGIFVFFGGQLNQLRKSWEKN